MCPFMPCTCPTSIPIPWTSQISACFMSSSPQTTISPSTFQLIVDALIDYSEKTGIDLANNPFADKIQLSESPDDILQLLQERENSFKHYRNRNRTLISCLTPAVRVLHVFSSTLGEAVSLVSHTCPP